MVDRVFLDANVVLDTWLLNDTGQPHAQKVLDSVSSGDVRAYLSIGVIQIIYFMACKEIDEAWVRQGIKALLRDIRIVDVSGYAVARALISDMPDLEDAIHLETAEFHFCTHFVTSDKALLKARHGLSVQCLSPADYLKRLAV